MGVPRLSVVESQEMYRNKKAQKEELKSLIREILEEKSGNLDHIMRRLCQIEKLPEHDVLRNQTIAVLKNWEKEGGLRGEKRSSNKGGTRYSLK